MSYKYKLLYLLSPSGATAILTALLTFGTIQFSTDRVALELPPEICDNGLDDDGDGFVDLFDQDCPCNIDAYQAYCPILCETVPDSFPDITLQLKWQSEIIVNRDHIYPNIVVGDLNQDGITEVITKRSMLTGGNNLTNGLLAFNGITGQTTSTFNSTPRDVDEENYFVSVADIDRDGLSEFFYSRADTIVCVNNNGTLRWKSDRLNEDGGYVVNLADFNGDGIPEAYKGNNIVNAQTGRLLVNGNSGGGCNEYQNTACDISHTIAADLRPANGLELAAGNTVYEVEITNQNGTAGNTMTTFNAANPVRDGLTSVGDIDGDGELDIVVVRSDGLTGDGVFVWNPRTLQLIARTNAGTTGGIAFIGNVAGDCLPEIGVTFSNELYMYRYDGSTTLRTLYRLVTTDGSGYTGVTMFDFNQDGLNELIYRDEDFLRIMEGNTGTTLSSYRVNNGTGMEYPVVADVDGDNEAEIIVSGYTTTYAQQRIFCFESGGSPWAPARNVWNQPGYHVTNVNDDLTIPRYPQNQAKALVGYENCLLPTCPAPYNAFMAQATFRTQEGCVQFPAPDLEMRLLSYTCNGDSISVCYAIGNRGDQGIFGKPIQFVFWTSNPTTSASTPILIQSRMIDLDKNEVDTLCVSIASALAPESLFIAINDPGDIAAPYTFPLTDLSECNYANNIDSIPLDLNTVMVVLDTVLCEGETLFYHDSLIAQAGQYILNGTNCDSVFNLTVAFTSIDTVYVTQSICFGDSLLFDGNWLNSSGAYVAQDLNSRGCDSTTFLDLMVVSQILAFDTLEICDGDSALINGLWQKAEASYTSLLPGITCDTLLSVWLEVHPVYDLSILYDACPGDSLWVDGQVYTQSAVAIETEVSVFGCDSIVTHIFAMPSFTSPPIITYDCETQLYTATSLNSAEWITAWSNGDTGSQTQYSNAGMEGLNVWSGFCHEHYDFLLPSIPDLSSLSFWLDTTILENHALSIDLPLDPDEWTVSWSPPEIFSCSTCLSTVISPTHQVTVTAFLTHSSGCEFVHSFSIFLEPIVKLYIPNVFSPNGDAINDQWIVTSPGEKIEILELVLFDRWGDKIKTWTNLTRLEWDGTFRDKPMNPGVFAFALKYRDQENKTLQTSGNITLLR